MDVRYLNPFIIAAQHVFKTMLETDVSLGRPYLRSSDVNDAELYSVIGFSGGATGYVALCLSKEVGVAVASKFAGEEIEPDSADLPDALGELANMISGQARAGIKELNILVSLPRVLDTREQSAMRRRGVPVLLLPFESELGHFTVELMMLPRKSTGEDQQTEPADEAETQPAPESSEPPNQESGEPAEVAAE